ncbi:helix-turn-helix domain-containing protein [Herbaspirillum sp. DW155]|uniref:helix-turn-helix domain-containing protein n=1 Tax=Herbaspirillum sp. DW155 TaxID=3095609 RepID=UPI0030915F95|nr:helix-turn-helix domain-containing protein [Herbaspirillum sp. DW155]
MTAYEDVFPDDPFEHWHQVTCRNYSVTECRSIKDQAFSAQVQVRPFGDLLVSKISSKVSPDVTLQVMRGNREIRKDYRDDFLIWFGRLGAMELEQDGRSTQLQSGDLMLHDQAVPFNIAFGQHCAALMITVPRLLMLSRFAQATNCTAMRVPAVSPLARIAKATLSEIALSDIASDLDTHGKNIWSPLLDICLAAIQSNCPQSEQQSEIQKSRLRMAQRYLRQRLSDPDISLSSVSTDLHMSSRTLLRLFAAHGTTPMQWLWQERLKSSYAALTSGPFKRVSDVAYAHGFRNLSHFSRSFKALHGINPQQLLRDA